jgi:hypothetical protein
MEEEGISYDQSVQQALQEGNRPSGGFFEQREDRMREGDRMAGKILENISFRWPCSSMRLDDLGDESLEKISMGKKRKSKDETEEEEDEEDYDEEEDDYDDDKEDY